MTDLPPNVDRFFALVWEIVRQVPLGTVTTFGQIASMMLPPLGVSPDDFAKVGPRWVGKALNAVSFSDDPTIPWQRVINSQGGVSLPPSSDAARLQRERLIQEGVRFTPKNVVDLQVYGWDGPAPDWLRERGLLPPRPLRKAAPPSSGQLSLF